MAIKLGDKDLFPYLGDYRPVNIYKGEHKVAGWKWESQSGEELHFENTYNDFVEVEIDGKSYQEGEPSPDNPIEIHSLNDFDVVSQKSEGGTIDGVEIGGRNLVLDSNGIIMGGSDDGNRGLAVREEDYVSITPTNNGNVYAYAKVKTSLDRVQGETYTVSLEVNTLESIGMLWYPSRVKKFGGIIPNTNGEWTKINHTYTQIGETKTGDTGFLWGFYGLTAGKEIKYRNLKLEKGNKVTDWTPAPEDITENDNHPLIDKINLLLSEPLRSVGDVKDRLFRDSDGLWKVERNVGETILDGSEQINIYRLSDDFPDVVGFYTNPKIGRIGSIKHMLSTHLVNYSDTWFPGILTANREEFQVTLDNYIKFSIYKNRLGSPDISGLKNWLSEEGKKGTPLTFFYVTKTSTTETLSQELQDKLNNLRSFHGSNYVYTTVENLKPTLHTRLKVKDMERSDIKNDSIN